MLSEQRRELSGLDDREVQMGTIWKRKLTHGIGFEAIVG